MCLLIHKPRGSAIPARLIQAAASLNRDGWGAMGVDARGRAFAQRTAEMNLPALLAFETRHRHSELLLHFRQLTRGSTQPENLHPIAITSDVLMMHNGTLPLEARQAGRSDSWALANQVLHPLVEHDANSLFSPRLRPLLELALADSRLALLQKSRGRILILNRALGHEVEGVWISNGRWVDRRHYELPPGPVTQERAFAVQELVFL